MPDSKYRVALYQAISSCMMENKKYMGSIGQDENGKYYILSDEAQELAVFKYEKENEKKKNNSRIQKGEDR